LGCEGSRKSVFLNVSLILSSVRRIFLSSPSDTHSYLQIMGIRVRLRGNIRVAFQFPYTITVRLSFANLKAMSVLSFGEEAPAPIVTI
jgi:hypothetical protein